MNSLKGTAVKRRHLHTLLLLLIAACVLTGCNSHVVTPAGADMRTFGLVESAYTRKTQTTDAIAQALELKPLARFPATIAVVRVQSAAKHSSAGGVSYGRGAYRVILTPTVEKQEHHDALAGLPMVNGVVRLNRLVLGENLSSDKQLRTAAARLRADLLLVYTINTEWTIDNDAEPLDAITFGLSRYKNIRVTSTATALLLGTHNGYIYASSEVMRDKEYKDNAWRNASQIEEAQEELEQQAYDGLVESLVQSWPQLVKAYAPGAEVK